MSNQELQDLKDKADAMNVEYPKNAGVDKMVELLKAADSPAIAPGTKIEDPAVDETKRKDTPAERTKYRNERIAEASKLIRIRLTCMNPAKKNWKGEIFTFNNRVVGTKRVFVPFKNIITHVPHCIYQMIQRREFQIIETVPSNDPRGGEISRWRNTKEFAIETLPPLTKAELEKLADDQRKTGRLNEDDEVSQ